MDYYDINLAPSEDMSFCMFWDQPGDLRALAPSIYEGEPVGAQLPHDLHWQMSKQFPGKNLPSLISNACNYLIVARPLRGVLEASGAAVEFLPFTLLDHKKRVASRDYCVVNPLGCFDCLHLEESEIERDDDSGEVVHIERMVLDTKKLENAPDLFRVKHASTTHVLSQRLVDALRALDPVPTNVYVSKVEQA